MAKKLSAFGQAFKSAKDGSTFEFRGKKYKKEYASEKKAKKSSLPATTNVKPKSRPETSSVPAPKSRDEAVKGMSSKPSFSGMADVAKNGFPAKTKRRDLNPFRDRKNSGVAATEGPVGSRSRGGGPYFKGTVKKSSDKEKLPIARRAGPAAKKYGLKY